MRRVRYAYALTLAFSAPVSRHTFLFRFDPPSDARQQIWGRRLRCMPGSMLPLTRDAFGNSCALGYIGDAQTGLTLEACGEALLTGRPLLAPCPDFYALPTALTAADEAICALCEGLSGAPDALAMELAGRIHSRVTYQKGVTDEHTTAAQALSLGAGVCQDMAHLLLAGLRAKGIPARYVCGLIPGEGETHAWVEVYDGARFIGVDPTQLCLTDDTYLAVNAGRDSRDCAINRGVFAGGAQQTMRVSARMDEL